MAEDISWDVVLKTIGAGSDSGRAATAAPTASSPSAVVDNPGSAIAPDAPAAGFDLPQQRPISVLPSSEETFASIQRTLSRAESARPKVIAPSRWADKDLATKIGARPGVPFDTSSGVPFVSRLAAEREPTQEEQVAAYKAEYGEENVRVNDFGGVVVTTIGEDGRTVDKLANPMGLDWKDAATVMAASPELLGSVLPLIATKGTTLGPGFFKALGTLALTAGGAELGGAAKDIFRRWVEGRDEDVKEVAQRRAVSGATGLIVGAGMGAGGWIAGRMISPFSAPGRLNFLANDAQQLFKEKYNIDVPMTAGQKTGSKILLAGEALEGQMPGGRTVFSGFKQKQLDQVNKLRAIATGAVEDEEAMGRDVLASAKGKLAPLEFDVELAAQEAQREAAAAIKTGIGQPVDKVKVGGAIDLGAKARKSGFDLVNSANYDAFYNNPLAKSPVIEGKGLKGALDDILADLPKVRQTQQQATGVLGPGGQPLTSAVDVDVPVGTPVRPRIEELASKLENGKVSINDLKQIRTDVDNAIKTGEAVPGVKEGRLKNLYGKLTEAIEQGLTDINDPKLTKAWRTATDYYKTNVGKFERAGIAEIFRDPINAMGPSELVDRALQSADTYATYKEFFGANSPQLKGVQQAAKDHVLNLGTLGKTVDAAEFARRLEELDMRSPQLLKDAFGGNAEQLRNEAVVMLKAQGKLIPKDELDRALSSGSLSADRLRDMITAETRRADAYANTLVKELSEGTIKPDRIRPTEVADKFVFRKETQPEHLNELMAQLNDRPEAQESLRRLTFKRVLDDATMTERSGERVIAPSALDNVLADGNLVKKLQTVLGESSYEDLVAVRDFLKAGQQASDVFKGAGGLAGNTLLNRVLGHGELSALPQFAKNFIMSVVYTSDTMRRLLSNTVLKQEGKALAVNAMIASGPWIKALGETFTKEVATSVQVAVKGAVDRMVRMDPQTAQPGVTTAGGANEIPWSEVLRTIGQENNPR